MSVFFVAGAQRVDLPLRRALAHATDREVIRKHLGFTDVLATGGLVPAGLPGHTPDIAVSFDPTAARAALADSQSLGSGQALSVWTAYEHRHDWWAELMDCWRDVLRIPVDVTVEAMSDNANFAGSSHHLALWHWVAGYPDPDYFLRVLLHSGSTSNSGGWHDARFDRLIDETMDVESGGSARLALFHEADRLAVREACAVIPIVYRRPATLVQPEVEGWWQWGAPMQSLDRITVRARGLPGGDRSG
jgi:oligopeptide transport system substrate-binding protein